MTHVRTFEEGKGKEGLVTEYHVKRALDKAFNSDFIVSRSTFAEDAYEGIDYFAWDDERFLSIDLKVRDNTEHRWPALIVEKEWLGGVKRTWLDRSRAEYFLFAHVFENRIQFYLLKSEYLRGFCDFVEPQRTLLYQDKDNTTAVLYVYDYNDYFAIMEEGSKITIGRYI